MLKAPQRSLTEPLGWTLCFIICLKYCVKYIRSSTVIKYNSEVLYSDISIFCCFILPLFYILEANIVFSLTTCIQYW